MSSMRSNPTPCGSLRLRQKMAICESLTGHSSVRSNRSNHSQPPLSKRPSLAGSAASSSRSMTGSQRNRLREYRAQAVFDQSTPYSTIRLIMSRAAEAPTAPAAPHLFRQLMEYFGTDDDEMLAIIDQQSNSSALSDAGAAVDGGVRLSAGIGAGAGGGKSQQENNNPSTSAPSTISSATSGPFYPKYLRTVSGTSTPASEAGDLSVRQLSNAEIMLYINTMIGRFPRTCDKEAPGGIASLEALFGLNLIDGIDDDSDYGYVSDCEPCDIDSLSGEEDTNNNTNILATATATGGIEEGGISVNELGDKVAKLTVSGPMRQLVEDDNYDFV
ncbi:hypothetical protein TWF481_011670 [Arthrobotrys musiformis]|uniref:Uncharacterized protein n=1 Tax=Arthrobotrys musiformis TaxID=47236 RepID=A0AAV9W1G0_9PEZI